jgi:long-chain acyl-CoA synthetase
MLKDSKWKNSARPFLFEKNRVFTYGDLFSRLEEALGLLDEKLKEPRPFVVEVENSFSSFLKILTLIERGYAVLPCASYQFYDPKYRDFLKIETQTDFTFCPRESQLHEVVDSSEALQASLHPLILEATAAKCRPYLVRTSGSSGAKYKYILHDMNLFFAKYRKIGPHFEKTLAFSPAESIAGIETLLETLTHGLSLVADGDRLSPQRVCSLIQMHSIDYFQTTPSFLTLMCATKHVRAEPLRSLRKIAYGSESSQKSVLETIQKELPEVVLQHTYGMSEIGILRTFTSPEDPSVFRPDESFNPWRLEGDLLEIRSLTPLLGYLNYPFQMTTDGWFRTGDTARIESRHIRILGRADDTINVAGRKFFPTELESLIMDLEGIADVTICRQKNSLIGDVIIAEILLAAQEEEAAFFARFKKFSEARIPYFMNPHRITLTTDSPENPRFKKNRLR